MFLVCQFGAMVMALGMSTKLLYFRPS